MSSKISIVRCADYEPSLVLEATKKALSLLGGIEGFIKSGSKVLVKPNLLMAKEPQFGITTHPEVVRAVVKILKAIQCQVFVGDSPNVWGGQVENVDEVYESTGIKKVCQDEGAQLVKFDKRRWMGKFPLTTWLESCDYLVNVPKFKTHTLTVLTGAIKNLFGLVPGTYKTELHKNYFHISEFSSIIVDIFQLAKPSLTIVDAITAMEADGPATAGKLRQVNLILAGVDCVALDSILSLLMGLNPFDVLTTKEAAHRGLGVANRDAIEVLGEKLEEISGRDFLLPATSMSQKLPSGLVNIAKKLIKYYPCVERDNCIQCAACIKVCPGKAISLQNNIIVFDYAKCIACFCCLEACPASAIKIRKSILAKMIGL